MKTMLTIIFLFALLIAPANAQSSNLGNPIISQQTAVAASSLVGKTIQGNLYGFSATSGASAGYVLIFDAAAAPSDGTVTPKFCYNLPANSTTGASWLSYPVPFQNGLVIEFSSTGCYSATASATAFITAQVR